MKYRKLKKVTVRWADATGESGWRQPVQYGREASEVESTGYLLGTNPRTLTLIQSVGLTSTNVEGSIVIPRRSIKSVKVLGFTKVRSE